MQRGIAGAALFALGFKWPWLQWPGGVLLFYAGSQLFVSVYGKQRTAKRMLDGLALRGDERVLERRSRELLHL